MNRSLAAGGLVVGLVLVGAPAEAQMGGVRGEVLDGEGRPVGDAKVVIEGRGELSRRFETETDDEGKYVRIGLPRGLYRVTAAKEGYQAVAVDHGVEMGEPTEVPDLTLRKLDRTSTVDEDAAGELRDKYARAVELTRTRRFDEAEALYMEILKALPGLGPVHQNLGYIAAERGDWARAEQHYLEALALTPDEPAVEHGLIRVYRESGQKDEALELVTRLAEENPEDATAQFNRALFLNDEGRSDEAAEAFEAALAADPALIGAHYELARIRLLQNRAPEAVEHLEAYLAGNPTEEQQKATAEGLLEALKGAEGETVPE